MRNENEGLVSMIITDYATIEENAHYDGKDKKDNEIHMLYGYTDKHHGSIRIKISRKPIGKGEYYEYGFTPDSKEYINFTADGATPDKKLMDFMLGFVGRYEQVLTANCTNDIANDDMEPMITNDMNANFLKGRRTTTPTGHVDLNYEDGAYNVSNDGNSGIKFKERVKK